MNTPATRWWFLLGIVCTLCISACGSDEEDASLGDDAFDSLQVVTQRKEKDRAFAEEETSPLPQSLKSAFTGLQYFAPNEEFSVLAMFEKSEKADTVQLNDSKGSQRTMLRVGAVRFSVGEDTTTYTLSAFQNLGETESAPLFIPFKDRTSGSDTYNAGRYLDVPYPSGSSVSIDFNQAYNPYCAYNATYSCPMVPQENILPLAIRAGEKKFTVSH